MFDGKDDPLGWLNQCEQFFRASSVADSACQFQSLAVSTTHRRLLCCSITDHPPSSATSAPRQFKKLTAAEMMERRRLGLCYNCDEQYIRGHKCAKLFYLEVTDSEEDNSPDQVQDTEEEPMISLHAISGVRGTNTLQVCVQVGERSSQHSLIQDPPTISSALRRHKLWSYRFKRTQARVW
jgi:hypothetical protein